MEGWEGGHVRQATGTAAPVGAIRRDPPCFRTSIVTPRSHTSTFCTCWFFFSSLLFFPIYVIGGNESRRQDTWLCTFQTFVLVHLAVFRPVEPSGVGKSTRKTSFIGFKKFILNKRSGANDVWMWRRRPPPLPRRNRQQWWWCSGGGALHSNQPFTSSRPLFWAIYSLLGALTKSCMSPRSTHTQKTKALHHTNQVVYLKIANNKEHQYQWKPAAPEKGSNDVHAKTTTKRKQTKH